MSDEPSSIPGTRRLAGYTAWNILGMTAPMVVALFAIPLLISGLGAERFGLLGLVWMLVGYFSIFDLGLGMALTKMTAERLGRRRQAEVPGLFWTATGLMFCFGLAGALLIAGSAPWLTNTLLNVPETLRPETVRSFYVVAAGMPAVITVAGLIGMLEAHQKFPLINAVRIPMGIFTFAGPLCVLPFSTSLVAVVAVLIAGRMIEWLVYFLACLRVVPALRDGVTLARGLLRPLLGFGGWLTISNTIMPLMIHIDRFLIGALVSVTGVAYYVTPAEIVIKLLIFPRAWVSVLLPSFAANISSNPRLTSDLYVRGVKFLMVISFPIVLAVVTLAGEGLYLWLGAEFAQQSAPVMRWLTVGLFIYSLAYLPFALLQSAGRPDLGAKLHLVELPCYLLIASLMIRRYGIEGAAMAWCMRAAIETVLLFRLGHRFVPETGRQIRRTLIGAAAAALILGLICLVPGLLPRAGLAALLGVTFMAWCWLGLFTREERDSVRQWFHNKVLPHLMRRPRAP